MNDSSRTPRRGFLSLLRRSDRGATLAFVAVAMVVLLGSTALAVDMGMFLLGRVQSQRAADAGALAGASELTTESGTEAAARAEAKEFANKHEILNENANVADGDVDVEMGDPRLVRVRVQHAFNTVFARVIGIDQVDIATTAAAEVQPAGGAQCAIPVAAFDRWEDFDHDPSTPSSETEFNGQWDGDGSPADELYDACDEVGETDCTGFQVDNLGNDFDSRRVEIKTSPASEFYPDSLQQTCQANDASGWLCWIQIPGSSGSNDLRDVIRGCTDAINWTVGIGDPVEANTGERKTALKEFQKLINDHGGEHLEWDKDHPDGPCVVDTNNDPSECLGDDHPLIRPMPLVDPSSLTGTGTNAEATVSNLADVFIEKVAAHPADDHVSAGSVNNLNLYVILLEGAAGGTGTGGPAGSLLNTVVLVE